jgi:hypothetical protein
MSLIRVLPGPSLTDRLVYRLGTELVKTAGEMTPAYNLAGMLYHKYGSHGDWIMLAVPNALVHGVFSAMSEAGIELPKTSAGRVEAHITVLRPEEITALGGPAKVTERGKQFHYRLGGLVTVEPEGWPEMAQVWMLRVHSPELQALRRSYGLSSLPAEGRHDFHITVAVRRKGILGRNDKAKEQTAGGGAGRTT